MLLQHSSAKQMILPSSASTPPPTHTKMEADGDREPICLICRVNPRIGETNLSRYSPERVSIGPLFKETSDWMKQQKLNRLYSALSVGHCQQADEIQPYLAQIAHHKERAQRYYYNILFSNTGEFSLRMLLDGYFVLSIFGLVRSKEAGWQRVPRVTLKYDRDVIFLFQNQVPFFMLKEIYKMLDPRTDEPNGLGNSNNSIVLETIATHIETILHENHYVHRSVRLKMNDGDPDHVVHLFYKYFLQPAANPNQDRNTEDKATDAPPCRWRSATNYYAAGVRLAKLPLDGDEVRSILDIRLTNGTLQVPRLVIKDSTLTILRNMVALEQCNPNVGSSVTLYCLFMAQVANTEEDVRLLSNKEIIVNWLSRDRDVSENFADLCRDIDIDISVKSREFKYQKRIIENLEKLCQSQCRKSLAWLRHTKCNNFLMTLAVVAAIIVFICAVEQSVFAALSYFMKR